MSTVEMYGTTVWLVLSDKETHTILSVNEHRVWDPNKFVETTAKMYPRMDVERVTEDQAFEIKQRHGW